jgi:phosphate:Na+ symporter
LKNIFIKYKSLLGAICLVVIFFQDFVAQSNFSIAPEEVTTVEVKKGLQVNFAFDGFLDFEGYGYLKYIKKTDFTSNDSALEWSYSEPLVVKNGNLVYTGFENNNEYFFAITVVPEVMENPHFELLNWSGPYIYKHDPSWSIGAGINLQILALLGALGLFIFGMKRMSEGIQKVSGKLLRQLIGGMTSNRANGIFFGFLTTAMVQSSSATSVTVVSFVNNGILKLKQGIAVIMGANVGTTITAWLIAYFGFVELMPEYALVIFLFSLILMFSANPHYKNWGEVLSGIALLFFGLTFFKSGIPEVYSSVEQLSFLDSISGDAVWNVFLATIIGAVLTIVFQSSIAMLVLVLLLSARGVIPFEMGLGMVLGGNIGTTITANIAAMTGNVNAKRVARAHLMFNLFGIIWMTLLFPYFIPVLRFLITDVFGLNDPAEYYQSRPITLAAFHSAFNVINATILYFFIDVIAKFVVRIVPAPEDDETSIQLGYIKAGMLATPELTIIEAKKEIAKFGKITSKMSGFFQKLLVETEKKKKKYLFEKIEKYEAITDKVELELSNYLTQTSEGGEMSEGTSRKVRAMMSIASSLERIGDVFYQMSVTIKRKEKEKIWFSPDQRQNLLKMLVLLDEAFEIMVMNLKSSTDKVDLRAAVIKESEIDKFRDKLRSRHFEDVEKHEYNIKSGIIYSDLFFSCEKIGDHIINVSEALLDEAQLEQVKAKIQEEKLALKVKSK